MCYSVKSILFEQYREKISVLRESYFAENTQQGNETYTETLTENTSSNTSNDAIMEAYVNAITHQMKLTNKQVL